MIEIVKFNTLGEQWVAVREDGDESTVVYYPLGTTFQVDITAESKQIKPIIPVNFSN